MSKVNKNDIGKGIRALLANIESDQKSNNQTDEEKGGSTADLDIRSIEVNPFQPRTEFDEDQLNELKESILTFGVIQPITVRKLNSKRFQIISGERRWRASQLAGLTSIPAYVREADDQGMLEMALLENIQRADLNPLEVAISYQRLIDECDLTHEELSNRLGKKRSSISNHLRVLRLAPSAQKALKEGLISLGHAKVLAGIENIEEQVEVLDQVLINGLSVRATEDLINTKGVKPKSVKSNNTANEIHPEVKKYQNQLSEKIGGMVSILRSGNGKGSIKINFENDEELNDIMDILLT
jgi:ParB family transcriptional regulator, chromosome partitioning protein